MDKIAKLSDNDMTRVLTYAGYVLLVFELTKSMIVAPIKSFYKDVVFHNGAFKSYQEDVLSRNKNEFEACLLYLRDFMDAIDEQDYVIIQALREHRNDLAHNLPDRLSLAEMEKNAGLLDNAKNVIFKLSNYRAYMETGQEPELRGVDWANVKGNEYLLLKTIIEKVKTLRS